MSTFGSLPEHKKQAILSAGFTCFGKNGYKKTSIADIAAEAGVSKASVFQYFGSKEKFYRYLFIFSCYEIIREKPENSPDFFTCIQNGSNVKIRVMERYPGMNEFLSSMVTETNRELVETLRAQTESQINAWTAALYSKVDWSRLREGRTHDELRSMARWTVDGYIRQWVHKKDARLMNEELAGYLDILRNAFYKEEWIDERN